jgi:FOG: FHA domain
MAKKVYASIQISSGSVLQPNYNIEKEIITIGRESLADIFVNDVKASRKHATLTYAGGMFKIDDLCSRNGTFVNGKKIDKSQFISFGDTIKIGDAQFVLTQPVNKRNSHNKAWLIAASISILVILAILIPVVLLTGKIQYKTIERYNQGQLLYSYNIPKDFTSVALSDREEIFFNNDKNILGDFYIEPVTENVLDEDLIALTGDFESSGFSARYSGLQENILKIDKQTGQWFNKNNPKINAYIIECEGNTSIVDLGGKYFWELKNSLIYMAAISAKFNNDYLVYFYFMDTTQQKSKDKDIVNNIIETLNIDVHE